MPRPAGPKSAANDAPVITAAQATGFRLARHHLTERRPRSELAEVLVAMNGAQAQVLSAAWTSLWARLRDLTVDSLESELLTRRSLVRAWCMRRTLFVLPSNELALYSRGSTRRAEKEVRWLRNRGVPAAKVERILELTLATMDEPRTRDEIALRLEATTGCSVRRKRGGGWGSARAVPWVTVEGVELPVGYLLHLVGARGVICSGPPRGAESTYVRADAWVRGWKDRKVPDAERALLTRYLRSFAPASPQDFAVWSGMRVGDAQELFLALGDELRPVRFGGADAFVLRRDLARIERSTVEPGSVRLLPNFDAFLLAHLDRRALVEARHHGRVFRTQGWVSPVLLVNGVVAGIWSMTRKGGVLRIEVENFGRRTGDEVRRTRDEAESLAAFLGSERADVRFSR